MLPKSVMAANVTKCVPTATVADKDSITTIVFFDVGRIAVLILASFQLLLEVSDSFKIYISKFLVFAYRDLLLLECLSTGR